MTLTAFKSLKIKYQNFSDEWKGKKVAVLMGGWNSEREVSLRSGEAVAAALERLRMTVLKIDFSHQIFEQLKTLRPDLVFNALHGQYGEDGRIQGVLDILQIPYTHSGALASAICMDKLITRKICGSERVKSPSYEVLHQGEDEKNAKKLQKIGKPFVIKPVNEGSSVGVSVTLENQPFKIEEFAWQFGKKMIVEKYLAGQEIHVAVIDGKAIGAIEVRPHGLFYDYKCKYTKGETDYVMPAEISVNQYQKVLKLAEKCFAAAGCKGIARVDFILNNKLHRDSPVNSGGDGEFYLLEINTHPGFTETSLVPKIANYVGISFDEIVAFLVQNAHFD
jgi:D-alanine-D-alanine ligase